MDDSPAAKAGFKKNDILVKAGDAPVKAPADLIKAVDASHGKQMIITIVRGGKDRKIEVTPAKRSEETSRREAARVELRAPNVEFREEIKRVEEALENLKNKAGKDGMSFWFARPGVVAPGITTQYYKIAPEFPKDLSVKIIKEGQEPTKIHVQRGDKEWNLTEDKQGVNLKELPEEIRAHVQRLLVGIPGKATMGSRVVRVTPEGKVEGELNITPAPPRPPVPPKPAIAPVAPAPGQARTFTYRTERNESSSDSKLDALISEVKQLRKEIDELRSKK